MLNIILFGPPGAGKGTQSAFITEKYGLTHLSTGDLFRKNIQEKTPVGQLAQTYIEQGQLVPDEVTIKLLENEFLRHPHANGFIFDGFPRTIAQAEHLDAFLSKHGTKIHCVIGLEAQVEELIERLLLRGQSSGRADDANRSVIKDRIREYEEKTAPLKAYFEQSKRYCPVNAVGEIEQVKQAIFTQINKNHQ